MKFSILTAEGKTFSDEIDYIVIHNEDGEVAILKDHIPIIIHIRSGHLKCVIGNHLKFAIIEQGILEFKDNQVSVLALDAEMGNTLEVTKVSFEKMKKDKLELTKKENIDLSKQERELKENIQKSKAGQL
jgi:F-type H+-transporting ATPase subunit epsilon